MKWLIGSVLAVALLLAAALALGAWGAARWAQSSQALLARLEATRLPLATTRYDARELAGLPAPVQRYFGKVLKDGQAMVTAATIEHTGSMNLSPTGEQWKPFTSQQHVLTQRPGFIWNARLQMMPGVVVYVHDAYIAGVGMLVPAVMGLFKMGEPQNGADLAQGELIRYLPERAWYPTALLPSQGVRWDAVDDSHAQATFVDGPLSVSMRVTFNTERLIEAIRFESRGAIIDKLVVMRPWEAYFSNYQEQGGMWVPMTGEVVWITPQGRKPYWRGTITAMAFEFA